MTLPDFLVIGAPKAGTTALHAALAAHPQIHMSPVKEPRFFLCDDGTPPPRRGGPGDAQTYQEYVWRHADYERLFDGARPGQICGESSPFYLWSRDAHQRIRSLLPAVKLVALLRDPVERAHSNWTHLWSAGLEPIDDFAAACAAEPRRVLAGWAPFWRYVQLGRYGEQVTDLLRVFAPADVLLLRYRDLRDAPSATLDRICAFLGVATGVITTVPHENVTTHVPASGPTHLWRTGLRTTLRAGATVGHLFPLPVRQRVRKPFLTALQGTPRPRQPLTAAQRDAVVRYFVDDVRLLERVTGAHFGDWLDVGVAGRGGLLHPPAPAGQRVALG